MSRPEASIGPAASAVRWLRWLAAIFAIAFCTGAAVIAGDGLNDKIISADLAVVPGNTVYPDGSMSLRLKARLDTALRLFLAHKCEYILVSGATGKEGVDEAAAMKTYLVAQGVPAERVLQDSAGINTEATARHTAELMRARQFNSVLAVSQYFHVTRLRMLLKHEGLSVGGNAHAHYFELRDAYSLPREVVAILVLLLGGHAGEAAAQ